MSRRSARFFIFLLAVFFFAAAFSAEAASLNELRQQHTEYQKAPLERVKQLRDKVEEMHKLEEGVARQFNIPVTRVLVFENRMEELINVNKIIRPAYESVSDEKNYIPLEER